MTLKLAVDILFRWLHVAAACLAIGGAFFIRVLLPIATRLLDPEHKQGVFLRARRAFKFVVHPAILVLLVSGVYNTMGNWPWYTRNPPLLHGLFGTHLLLALAVITISLVLLAGREPIRTHRGWIKVNLVLMALTIAAASSLKWAREHTPPPEGTRMLPVRGPTKTPS